MNKNLYSATQTYWACQRHYSGRTPEGISAQDLIAHTNRALKKVGPNRKVATLLLELQEDFIYRHPMKEAEGVLIPFPHIAHIANS